MTARRRIRLVLVAQRCFLGISLQARPRAVCGNHRRQSQYNDPVLPKLWEIIVGHNAPEEKIEVDESHFGGYRKDKRAPGRRRKSRRLRASQARWSRPCRDDPRCGKREAGSGKREAGSGKPMSLIRRKIRPDPIVYSDVWHAYRTIDISGFLHERISHARRSITYTNGYRD